MALSKFQIDVKGWNLRILFLRRLVVLVLVCVQPVSHGVVLNDVPLNPQIDTPDLINNNKYPILHSTVCQTMTACHIGDHQKANRELLCYYGQREDGFKYQCVDTSNGAVEFFSPDDICERGTRKVAIILRNDKVYLRKETCPDGYYQLKEGECLKGCSNKHPSLPPHVVVIKEGTSISLGIGNCEEGYVNLDGELYFRLDRATSFTCQNRNKYPELLNCSHGDNVLTNMTCVAPCHNGTVRYPWDGTCVPVNHIPIVPTTSGDVGSSEKPSANVEDQPTTAPVPPQTTGNEENNDTEDHGPNQSTLVVIICGTVLAAVIVVSIGGYIYCWKMRGRENNYSNNSSRQGSIKGSKGIEVLPLNTTCSECSSQGKTVIKNNNKIGTYANVVSKNATINIHNQCSSCSKKSSNGSAASIEDVDDDVSNDGTITDREQEPLLEDLKLGIQTETKDEQPATFGDARDIVEADIDETAVKEVC